MDQTWSVRDYEPGDQAGWLRCRTLAFLETSYFDDVFTAKPIYTTPAIELVAAGEAVVGLIDVAIDGPLATIETIAVHPDVARTGIGSALIEAALTRLPAEVATLDAWTREDDAANGWYRSHGFVETFRYLHVFASGAD
jgi:ribosomal protein S18 acetylase RimI-like enzyme